MSAGSSSSASKQRGGNKAKGAVRAKSGCYTCRIRRKKCDEKMDAEGSCQTCARLRLQCLGFGAKRPDWMREGNSVAEIREKIKTFLAQNGMIKGHSGTANLRPSGPSIAIQGASTSTNAASPSDPSLPLPQGMTNPETNGLSPPLSASSTLTPDDRSASPSTPPNSRVHQSSFASDRLFPSGHNHPQEHFVTSQDASGVQHGPGILHLSNGRPLPTRSQSTRIAHHAGHGYGFGGPTPGLGLMMDPINTNGNGTPHNSSHTRYGTRTSETLPFPRAYSMTAITQPYMNTMTQSHAPPSSSHVSSSFFRRLAPSFPGDASRTNIYPNAPSTEPFASNFISNTAHVGSPTFGSTSSSTSSPPLASRDTPFTPYTPQPPLPALPSNGIKSTDDMDCSPAISALPPTPFSMPTPTSDAPLLSPYPDAGSFGPDIDAMLQHHPAGHVFGPDTPNNDTGTNTPIGIRVKTEPDPDGFNLGHYAAHDSNTYAHGISDALRPRSSTDTGCVAPSVNNFANYNPYSTDRGHLGTSPSYFMGAFDHNVANNHAHSSPSNVYAFHHLHASTPMGTRGHPTLAVHAVTDNSPYPPIPQLAPDSPKPPRDSDPMIGAYTSNSVPGAGPTYVGTGHHVVDEFSLNSGSLRHGAGHGGIGSGQNGHNYGHSNGYGHSQTTPSSSWPGNDTVRPAHHQHQTHSQASFEWQPNGTPTVSSNGPAPASLQSSFGASYNFSNYSMELAMNAVDADTFGAQQAPMPGMTTVGGVDEGALIPYYTPAPIGEEIDFYNLPQEEQQRVFQAWAPLQLLQPALMDPQFADRADRSLVEHYLHHVRPKQYFFWDERVVDLLRGLALKNEAVRDAICSVASVHIRRMREGGIQLHGRTPASPSRRTPLLLGTDIPDIPEGDDGNAYYDRTRLALRHVVKERLTQAEAMAGLQCISSFLFAGGVGGWDFFLDLACQWVDMVFASARCRHVAGDVFLLDALTQMKREDELGSFVVRTTMWFEVLASVTMVRPPKFLEVYQVLFADSTRIIEIDRPVSRTESKFSMLEVMGCDNLTFLALAEISALAAWKEEEERNETLSFVELAERKAKIEEHCLRALAEAEASILRDGSALNDDSLQNRRRLTADIFRASARLYLHTVLSGDKPGVKEIRDGVRDTIGALKRVPPEPKSLRCSVVRSVVFPLCLAGCMTDDTTERKIVKEFLEGEGGAGNCGSVVAVMETVWERRDAKRRGGRRSAEDAANVSWRDVLRERGGGTPILLV